MLYWFLLYNEVNQLYVYIQTLLFGLPSLGHHRALRIPCAILYNRFSWVFYFIHSIKSLGPFLVAQR